MNNTYFPPELLAAVPKLKKQSTPAVELVGKQFEEGWHLIKTAKTFTDKPLAEWNKKDLVGWFYKEYERRYGQRLSSAIPYGDAYNCLADLDRVFQTKLGFCDVQLLKDYFDYCYNHFANDIIKTKQYFSMRHLKKMVLVLNYCDNAKPKKNIPITVIPSIPTEKKVLTKQDLDLAYKISPQHFVKTFGTIVPVNYLILVKKKSEQQSIEYVDKAIKKLGLSPEAVLTLNSKNGPYPKWFPYRAELNIEVSAYDFLRDNNES